MIRESVDGSTLLIAIVTPSYLKSDSCRKELDLFLEVEKVLGRDDLILPVIYVETPALGDGEDDPLATQLGSRQWFDCQDLRFADLGSEASLRAIAELGGGIASALLRSKQEPASVGSVALAAVDAEMDDVAEPGFVELVAEAEGAMPEFTETLKLFAETLRNYAQLTSSANDRMKAAEKSPKPSKAKLGVIRQLTAELDEPTARMEELAVDYVDQLARVNGGIEAMVTQIATLDDQDDIDAAMGLRDVADTLATTADESLDSLAVLRSSLAKAGGMSSTMRPVTRRASAAPLKLEPSRHTFAQWRDALNDGLAAHRP